MQVNTVFTFIQKVIDTNMQKSQNFGWEFLHTWNQQKTVMRLTHSSNGLQLQNFPSGVTIIKLASLMYRFDNWGVHAVESYCHDSGFDPIR
jgi:hypothetical protein